MHFRTSLVLAASLLCSSCGHFVNVKSTLETYHNAEPAFASFSDITYEKLDYPAEVSFSIDEKSPMMDFGPLGKSYVKAFELPEAKSDFRLIVRSYVIHDGLIDGVMFAPLVTFLDVNKNPIATSKPSDLQLLQSTFWDEPTEPQKYQFATLISAQDPARYIVIHTSRDLIEFGRHSSSNDGSMKIASTTFVPLFIPAGPTGPVSMPGSPIGDLKIRTERPRT